VLIYFHAETRQAIVGRLQRQLRPDGYLALGAAENLLSLDAVERVTFGRAICYRPRQG
jgi:chemotaxis methyl-accepting protein methylase